MEGIFMGKAILVCGKLCSGKTTYAESISREENAVLLSVDQIMLSLFGQQAGEKHDEYVLRLKKYLLEKSSELLSKSVNVILDWGFWTRSERDNVRDYFHSRNVDTELHLVELNSQEWKRRINVRNQDALENEGDAYFIDKAVLEKFEKVFEQPEDDEIDIYVRN